MYLEIRTKYLELRDQYGNYYGEMRELWQGLMMGRLPCNDGTNTTHHSLCLYTVKCQTRGGVKDYIEKIFGLLQLGLGLIFRFLSSFKSESSRAIAVTGLVHILYHPQT